MGGASYGYIQRRPRYRSQILYYINHSLYLHHSLTFQIITFTLTHFQLTDIINQMPTNNISLTLKPHPFILLKIHPSIKKNKNKNIKILKVYNFVYSQSMSHTHYKYFEGGTLIYTWKHGCTHQVACYCNKEYLQHHEIG